MLYFRYRLGRDVYTLYTVQALVYRLQHRFGDYIQLYVLFTYSCTLNTVPGTAPGLLLGRDLHGDTD